MAQTKTLFFIAGVLPTSEDIIARDKMEGKVCFRNVNYIVNTDNLEDCNFVAGCVPSSYLSIPFYGASNETHDEAFRNDEVQARREAGPKGQAPGKGQAKPEKVDVPKWTPNA